MIDSLESFVDALDPYFMGNGTKDELLEIKDVYCPTCQAGRRVSVRMVTSAHLASCAWMSKSKNRARSGIRPGDPYKPDLPSFDPSVFTLTCLQCKGKFAVLTYYSDSKIEIAIFPQSGGGFSTKHTPPPVAHFLNEAYKCQSVGSYVAAGVMYRAAVEQLLKDQNCAGGTLDALLKNLAVKQSTNEAPAWVAHYDIAFLDIIRKLGNEVHLKSGNVDNFEGFDATLMSQVAVAVRELLKQVYEEPARKKAALEALSKAQAQIANKPDTTS